MIPLFYQKGRSYPEIKIFSFIENEKELLKNSSFFVNGSINIQNYIKANEALEKQMMTYFKDRPEIRLGISSFDEEKSAFTTPQKVRVKYQEVMKQNEKFLCPITKDFIFHPIKNSKDGKFYEKDKIMENLKKGLIDVKELQYSFTYFPMLLEKINSCAKKIYENNEMQPVQEMLETLRKSRIEVLKLINAKLTDHFLDSQINVETKQQLERALYKEWMITAKWTFFRTTVKYNKELANKINDFFNASMTKEELLEFKVEKFSKEQFLQMFPVSEITRKKLVLDKYRFSVLLNYERLMRIFHYKIYGEIGNNYSKDEVNRVWEEVFSKMKEEDRKEKEAKVLEESGLSKISQIYDFVSNNPKKLVTAAAAAIGGVVWYQFFKGR